jgi:hypothetical protein
MALQVFVEEGKGCFSRFHLVVPPGESMPLVGVGNILYGHVVFSHPIYNFLAFNRKHPNIIHSLENEQGLVDLFVVKQWGWGTFIAGYFDSARLIVSNQAMAGRSTRTFTSEGRWTRVMSTLKKGDFVMMQFGHNEFIMAELHHNKITLFKGRHHPGPSAF